MNKITLSFVTAILLLFSFKSNSQSYDVTKFGAKEGVDINNSAAIQRAIDKCTIKGYPVSKMSQKDEQAKL